MPFDLSRYPANWKEISDRIKTRAGWKCEQCGLPHGAIVARYKSDKSSFLLWDEKREVWLDGWDGKPIYRPEYAKFWDDYEIENPTKIVLTTHHMGAPYPDGRPGDVHDKMDCRDENLIALCQRCHFIADLPYHIISARISRAANKRKRQLEAGQMELFEL